MNNEESPSRENQLTHRPARLPPLQNSPDSGQAEPRVFRSASSNPQIAEFNVVLDQQVETQVDQEVENYVSNIIQDAIQPSFRQRQLNTNVRDPETGVVPQNLQPVQTQSLIETLQVVRLQNSEIEYTSEYSEVQTEEMHSSHFRDSNG